jgi:4-amino-4-deoxy-L-arabinose transferase-like glycosyltransferase
MLLLLLILVTAASFRTYKLSSFPPGLYPDEAMNGNNALHAARTGEYKVFYPENYGREGLFINTQAMALKIVHAKEPWVLRSVRAIFGTLTVLGLFFLVRELFDCATALWASFFMATGFWHIVFSRIGFRAISSAFWLIWALYCVLVSYRKLHEGVAFRKVIPGCILGGLLFGTGFNSYIAIASLQC